eukprot:314839-Prymnesium_polylepis.1
MKLVEFRLSLSVSGSYSTPDWTWSRHTEQAAVKTVIFAGVAVRVTHLQAQRLLDAEKILAPRARSGAPHTRPASIAQPLPACSYRALFAGGPLRLRAERVQQTPGAFPGGLKAHGGLNTNLWTPYRGCKQ